ncbi:hypothetical protein ABFS82_14G157800 [Erythranthe guttata]
MAAEKNNNNTNTRKPNFLPTSKLKTHMKNLYHYVMSHAVLLFIFPAVLSSAVPYFHPHQITQFCNNPTSMAAAAAALIIFILSYCLNKFLNRPKKIYLVDFACYNHDPSFSVSRATVYDKLSGVLSPESLAFTAKVMERSGVCDSTFLYFGKEGGFPPESAFSCGREEAETVVCGAVDDVLAKTGVDPTDIGVVIVNISTFNPVPSLSAMIVNRYKMREDVLTFNLGGMGCSAGVIAVDLARRLLQGQGDTYALIMSVESPTASYYVGDDKSKLLSNLLFRMGGAAILLSNRPSDRRTSKYELTHTLRTHLGSNDRAYKSVLQQVDATGKLGMSISKDLISVAGDALRSNITALAPSVLPISEQLIFAANLIARKLFKVKGLRPHAPDFRRAFEHFCIHAGGKAVLDEVEKNLKLTKWDMEPSRMTLYRYSNTSSSSFWYELAYTEAKGRIKKGDRVWQIAFGSGFKCGSGVWRAVRTINPGQDDYNPWARVIHEFPIDV